MGPPRKQTLPFCHVDAPRPTRPIVDTTSACPSIHPNVINVHRSKITSVYKMPHQGASPSDTNTISVSVANSPYPPWVWPLSKPSATSVECRSFSHKKWLSTTMQLKVRDSCCLWCHETNPSHARCSEPVIKVGRSSNLWPGEVLGLRRTKIDNIHRRGYKSENLKAANKSADIVARCRDLLICVTATELLREGSLRQS